MPKDRAQLTKAAPPKLRVVVIDDHPVVRVGLKQRLSIESDIDVCGEADSMVDAYQLLAQTRPDVTLLDIALKDGSGLDLIKEVRSRGDTTRILIVSTYPEMAYAERCIQAGAQGYLQKDAAVDELVKAIHVVAKGDLYLSEQMTHRALKHALTGDSSTNTLYALSDRELQVYEMIGNGMTVGAIAERLFLSPKTIETYRAHLKTKLKLRSSAELARHAYKWSMDRS